MQQQINFFNYLPVKRQEFFTFRWFLLVWVLFLLLCFAVSTVTYIRVYYYAGQLEKINKNYIVAKKQIDLLIAENPNLDLNDASSIIEKQNKIRVLLAVNPDIAMILHVFSNWVPEGLWLSEIHFSVTDGLDLRGGTLRPVYVEQLIQALVHLPIFAGYTFRLAELSETGNKKMTWSAFHLVAGVQG